MSKDTPARDKSRATTDRIEQRAQWEAFDFSVPEPGRVRVENHSHAAPSEHTYDVTVEHGSAVACACKFDEYNSEACKHRVAVENTPAVLAAAAGVVATDGGVEAKPADDDVVDLSEEYGNAPSIDVHHVVGVDGDRVPVDPADCDRCGDLSPAPCLNHFMLGVEFPS